MTEWIFVDTVLYFDCIISEGEDCVQVRKRINEADCFSCPLNKACCRNKVEKMGNLEKLKLQTEWRTGTENNETLCFVFSCFESLIGVRVLKLDLIKRFSCIGVKSLSRNLPFLSRSLEILDLEISLDLGKKSLGSILDSVGELCSLRCLSFTGVRNLNFPETDYQNYLKLLLENCSKLPLLRNLRIYFVHMTEKDATVLVQNIDRLPSLVNLHLKSIYMSYHNIRKVWGKFFGRPEVKLVVKTCRWFDEFGEGNPSYRLTHLWNDLVERNTGPPTRFNRFWEDIKVQEFGEPSPPMKVLR